MDNHEVINYSVSKIKTHACAHIRAHIHTHTICNEILQSSIGHMVYTNTDSAQFLQKIYSHVASVFVMEIILLSKYLEGLNIECDDNFSPLSFFDFSANTHAPGTDLTYAYFFNSACLSR